MTIAGDMTVGRPKEEVEVVNRVFDWLLDPNVWLRLEREGFDIGDWCDMIRFLKEKA